MSGGGGSSGGTSGGSAAASYRNRGGSGFRITRPSSSNKPNLVSWMIRSIMGLVVLCVTFYLGMIAGMHFAMTHQQSKVTGKLNASPAGLEQAGGGELNKEKCEELLGRTTKGGAEAAKEGIVNKSDVGGGATNHESHERFPATMKKLAVGMIKVPKQSLMETFDYGVPIEHSSDKTTSEALIIYRETQYLPSDKTLAEAATKDDGNGIPLTTDVYSATDQCPDVSVILTQSSCLAIVGTYPSFHIHRFMYNEKSTAFEHVGRGVKNIGNDRFKAPDLDLIQQHWKLLQKFHNHVDVTLEKLRPITSEIARDNTIIVMVCNFGQSQLLVNFVCGAKSKGINLDNVLLFATDEETLEIARGLGLNAYYDDVFFADMPSNAAKRYQDKAFTAMMYAKVLVVQWVNFLGYDVLFSDVDIVWLKDPHDAFHNTESDLYRYDALFQDDGARSLRYQPYSGNSGFYYLRHNDRTRYLLINLLFQGDLIQRCGSHQQILAALLPEYASLYGLKVKTLDGDDWPGGFQYHRRGKWYVIRDMFSKKKIPYIFHMSWTLNKDNKLLFFKQMGMWYVNDQCAGKTYNEILEEDPDEEGTPLIGECCAKEPLISCHYRDKPAILDCSDSPPIDKNGKPYWTK